MFYLGMLAGVIIGISMMCLLQINRSDYDGPKDEGKPTL